MGLPPPTSPAPERKTRRRISRETLQPFEVQNKTLTKRYTLHSRIVERDIYEMCKTIIGSQAVWMWDTTLSDWVRCSMEDSEAEDSGAPMQDLVIEVVKREYNL